MPVLLVRENGRVRGWPAYVGAVGLGAAALALASLWTSGAWATGIGAAVTTLSGLVAERLQPQRGTAAGGDATAAGADALLRTAAGRIPTLRQVDRPEPAGAHHADGRPADGSRTPAAPPAYIRRDVEPQLREALGRAGFVLLVGESTAGKSRLAHEVARTLFPGHAFVRPLGRAALPQALRVAGTRRRAVLWLDDLEEFLGAGGLTTAMLAALSAPAPGRRVVVATMRTQEFRRFDAREEGRLTGSDRDAWRTQRDVLRQAEVVRLARHWSPEERRRAAAHGQDPRIRAALRAGSASASRKSSPPDRSCSPPGTTPGHPGPIRAARPWSRPPWTAGGPDCEARWAGTGCANCTGPTWRNAAAATYSRNPSTMR